MKGSFSFLSSFVIIPILFGLPCFLNFILLLYCILMLQKIYVSLDTLCNALTALAYLQTYKQQFNGSLVVTVTQLTGNDQNSLNSFHRNIVNYLIKFFTVKYFIAFYAAFILQTRIYRRIYHHTIIALLIPKNNIIQNCLGFYVHYQEFF